MLYVKGVLQHGHLGHAGARGHAPGQALQLLRTGAGGAGGDRVSDRICQPAVVAMSAKVPDQE